MKSWGKQGFLNPVDSRDDGSFKFSIRPSTSTSDKSLIGPMFDDKFTITDCGEQITLDFGIGGGIWAYQTEGEQRRSKKKILKQIKDRRAKIRLLRSAVEGFADALEACLDEIETDVVDFQPRPQDDGSKRS